MSFNIQTIKVARKSIFKKILFKLFLSLSVILLPNIQIDLKNLVTSIIYFYTTKF
jgi:hypothetical protein